MSTTNTSGTAPSADTMTVTVRDSEAEARSWGNGRGGIVTRTVTISAHCPRCGERRGEPFGHNFCDDGEWAWVQRWVNPCGHVDMYAAVLAEAAQLAAQLAEESPATGITDEMIAKGAEAISDLLTMLDVDPDERIQHNDAPPVAAQLAELVLQAGLACSGTRTRQASGGEETGL